MNSEVEADQHRDGDRHQHEPVDGERCAAERDAAERRPDARRAGAQEQQRTLGHDEADAPGRDQRIDRPVVEPAHDGAFEEDAEETARHGAEQHGQRERHSGVIGIGRHIRAHGDELAVGHVDDPHHSENDREARGGKHEKGEHIGDLIDKCDDLGRLHFASLTTLRLGYALPSPVCGGRWPEGPEGGHATPIASHRRTRTRKPPSGATRHLPPRAPLKALGREKA